LPDKERQERRRQLVPGKDVQERPYSFVPDKEQQERQKIFVPGKGAREQRRRFVPGKDMQKQRRSGTYGLPLSTAQHETDVVGAAAYKEAGLTYKEPEVLGRRAIDLGSLRVD
jgi:hypothetical protein